MTVQKHGVAGIALVSWALLVGILMLVQRRLQPPPEGTSPTSFSATQALVSLRQIATPQVPHPVGSPRAETFAQRVAAALDSKGVAAEVIPGLGCSPKKTTCGQVLNVVGRLAPPDPNDRARPALLISAHHDSVAAGPGAGDDGAGVATLIELAGHLAADPARRNPIYFVAVDGEEEGLLGAHALMSTGLNRPANPLGPPTVAVNLDAGGTRGVTSLTRTSKGNSGLIDLFAEHVPRPHGSSVIAAAYNLTPYDTDFTAYDTAGLWTLDLGFGEDKTHYHTPLDTLENLDPASVQHLGDTALSLALALAHQDLARLPRPGDQVHVDALGWALWHLPTWAAMVLAWLALVGLGLGAARGCHQRSLTGTQLVRACLMWPLLAGLSVGIVAGLCALAGLLTDTPAPAAASPMVLRTAVWGLALVISLLVLGPSARALDGPATTPQSGALAFWWAGWLWLGFLTAAVAVIAPAACSGTLAPVVVAACLCPFASRPNRRGYLVLVIVNLAAAVILLQGAVRMEWIFGLRTTTTAMVIAPLVVLASLQLPLWRILHVRTRKYLGRPVTGISCLAYLTLLGLPDSSVERPKRLNVVIHQHLEQDSARPETRVVIDAKHGYLPLKIRDHAPFLANPTQAFAWTGPEQLAWVAPLESAPLAGPSVTPISEIEGPWGRVISLQLAPGHAHARSLGFVIPEDAGVKLVRLAGQPLAGYPARKRKNFPELRHYRFVAPPPTGIRVELVVEANRKLPLTAWEVREGVPQAAQALVEARPPSAVSSGPGDRTIVSRSIEL